MSSQWGINDFFVRKCNENSKVIRYKARLVTQGFSQRSDIDYEETYSPVVDAITFRYLINMTVHQKLEMHLMDVVTAYLYGSLDHNNFMKIPEALKVPEAYKKIKRKLFNKASKIFIWIEIIRANVV